MKLTLFSDNITYKHVEELKKFFDKSLSKVKICYITTPTNYKPFKPEWSMESQKRLISIFPLLQEFDLERAYKLDNNFSFENHLSQFDYVFISGGNTFILSYWMTKTGTDHVLKKLIKDEMIVYGGESAGAIYPFEDLSLYAEVDDPQKAPEVVNEGLGLITFAPLPHWENQEFQVGLQKIKDKFEEKKVKIITINDNQAIFVNDDKIEVL